MTDENNSNTQEEDEDAESYDPLVEDDTLNECGEKKLLLSKNCKYFHHDPYFTPNNFDIYFDYHKIPKNIKVDKPHELRKRLQRTMPLTKIIHVNLEAESFPHRNDVNIGTSIHVRFIERIKGVNKERYEQIK